MPRIRTIKPEFQNSQSMGRVSRDARLTFIELWPQCDDAGRIRANSRMLASVLFPYDEDAAANIEGWLSELEKEHCIVRYTVERDEYLAICHWDHQKIDHPQPSKLPSPPTKNIKKTKLSVREQQEKPREPSSDVRAVSSTVSGPVPDQVSPSPRAARAEFEEEFWSVYPRKVGKDDALKAFVKARKRAQLSEIIAGAKRYAASRDGQDAQYTAHASTWLNRGSWQDELASPQATSGADPPLIDREKLARIQAIEAENTRKFLEEDDQHVH